MTLVERIRVLANQEGMNLPELEAKLGLGNGTISRWNKSKPNTEKLIIIADHFKVSTDYLLGRELTERDEKNIAKDLDNIMNKLTSMEDGPINFNGVDMSEETVELFKDELQLMLKRLKMINKEIYNPNKKQK